MYSLLVGWGSGAKGGNAVGVVRFPSLSGNLFECLLQLLMAKTGKKSRKKLGRSSSKYIAKKKTKNGQVSLKNRLASAELADPTSEPVPNVDDASTSAPMAPLGNVASPEVTQEGMKASNGTPQEVSGFIFLCSGRTKPECFRYRVFGLPSMKLDVVKRINSGSKLFLFDFDLKLLYGVYEATSHGELNAEPLAFNGKFPSQVRFKIFRDCLPVPESIFKRAIKENYEGSKFRQELNKKQVKSLIDLFRPIDVVPAPSTFLHNQAGGTAQPTHILDKCLVPISQLPPPVVSHMPERLPADIQPVTRPLLIGGVTPRLYEHYRHESVVTHPPANHYVHQPAADAWYYPSQVALTPQGNFHILDQVHQPYVPEEPKFSSHDIYGRSNNASVTGEQSGGYTSDYYKKDLPVAGDLYSGDISHHGQIVSSLPVANVTSHVQSGASYYPVQASVSSDAYHTYYDPSYLVAAYGNSNSTVALGHTTSISTSVYEGTTSTSQYVVADPAYAAQQRRAAENMYVADPNLPVSHRYSFPWISSTR